MVNVLFNDFSYEILPKQLETFDKYSKILQWGRANPTRFLEDFVGLKFTDHQKYVLLSSWIPSNVVWVCSRSTGKSFMSAPFIMARSLLIPSHNTYIMGPTGSQAQETFTKMENPAVNAAAIRKLERLMFRPNMQASTSTVVMVNLCRMIPRPTPARIPMIVSTIFSR